MFTILEVAAKVDTLREAVTEKLGAAAEVLTDTTGKSELEKGLITKVQEVTNTPFDQLLSSLLDAAVAFGLKLLAAIAIYIIGGYLIKWAKKLLNAMFTKRKTEPAIVSFTMSLVTAALWVVVIIIAVGTLGIETTSLAALLAAGGMAIGMALSGTVQNFAGGIMILAFKPFKAGDFIEAQGFAGTVTEVNITSTKLTTPDNKVIVLPNGSLSNGTINNFSRMPMRRVDFNVSVEYGNDSEVVKNLLTSIAATDERVLTEAKGAPADPFAGVSALGNSSVDFAFRVWVNAADYWGVFFALNEKIYNELPKNGVKFPFQQISVHMEKEN